MWKIQANELERQEDSGNTEHQKKDRKKADSGNQGRKTVETKAERQWKPRQKDSGNKGRKTVETQNIRGKTVETQNNRRQTVETQNIRRQTVETQNNRRQTYQRRTWTGRRTVELSSRDMKAADEPISLGPPLRGSALCSLFLKV